MSSTSIIFDLDGTLWNTTEIVAKAWRKAADELGLHDVEITGTILKKYFGKTMDVIAAEMFPMTDEETREKLMELCYAYEHDFMYTDTSDVLFPGVRETLTELSKKYPLYIVSNCQKGYIEMFLEKNRLAPYFIDSECYGNTMKPKGYSISLLVERNSLTSPVYVGDTQGDCVACIEAHVPFIFAAYGFGQVTSYFKKIDDITDLLTLFP